jgi:hypothetical protein
MGLAFLIVIIVVGGLFFFTREGSDKTSGAVDYENDLLTQTVVDVYLRTDVQGCPGYTLYDVVRDVTLINENPCSPEQSVTGETASQTVLNDTMKAIMETVTPYKYDFLVARQSPGEEPVAKVTIDQCPSGSAARGRGVTLSRRAEQRIPLLPTRDIAIVSLQLCPGVR